MVDNENEMDIEGLLARLSNGIEGDTLTLGEMVEAVESRGFGPILLVPALLAVLPTGAVPGMPTVCAALVLMVAGQMVLGKKHPWVPRRLRQVSVSRENFEKAREKVRPVAAFIDRFIYPRLGFLTTTGVSRALAVLAILIAMTMPPLEVVPFAVFLPGTALVLLGLGLSARDGLLILVGATIGSIGVVLAGRTLLGLAS